MIDFTEEPQGIRDLVRERYSAAARLVLEGSRSTCCGSGTSSSSCCSPLPNADPITSDLYEPDAVGDLPAQALEASLGCGNPTALASLSEGETVLDLGSGGGIDVLLAARRVGPSGFAYGLDMTDEMLQIAESNRAASGLDNVRFLKGHIEDIPLPDQSVDVVISNCVINLSGDKDRVFRESFRVLRPGGRLAISDIVWRLPVPETIRRSADLWTGCIAGASLESEYHEKLLAAGFRSIDFTPTRTYSSDDMADLAEGSEDLTQTLRELPSGALISAFIRAEKPV